MALNWVQRDPHNAHRPLMLPGKPFYTFCINVETNVVLYPGERTLESLEQAELSLEIPPTLSGPKRTTKSSSTMWLTNQRIVFISTSTGQSADAGILGPVYSLVSTYLAPTTSSETSSNPIKLDSLTIPYSSIRDITFEQGLFTPNGLRITFIPVPDGNLPELGRGSVIVLQVSLMQGRVYEVWKRARELWVDSQGRREEEETLPKYTPH